jgi:uncharacterized membrane protein YgcG
MTERSQAARRGRRRDGLVHVLTASAAIFMALFAFLGVQMREGKDPALGARKVADVQAPRRRVTVRRVIEQRVVVERDDGEGDGEGEGEGEGGGGAGGRSSTSGMSGATAESAPSAAPARTPSPARAPVATTRSS